MYAAASVTIKWRLGSTAYYRLAARQSGDGFVVVILLLAMFHNEIDDSMNDDGRALVIKGPGKVFAGSESNTSDSSNNYHTWHNFRHTPSHNTLKLTS